MIYTKTAALYVRVSTDFQAEEGYSIEFQTEKLKAYCDATSLTVRDVFTDGGYSGSNMDRPALTRLLKRIKEFDTVIVYKLDRLSRSQKDTLHLIEDVFIPNDVAFISLSESFDTGSAFGRATIGILSVFSQLERENIKQRMMEGKVQKAKNGYTAGQINTAIGYRKVGKELVVDEYEREQILKIAEMYISGMGILSILKKMKPYATSYGNWCNESTVNQALFNPLYRGIVSYGGKEYPGLHEAIISEELYKKILEQKLKASKGQTFNRSYLLSGIIYCELCGGRIAGHNWRGHKNYACYNATRSSEKMTTSAERCPMPMISKKFLDNVVKDEIKNIHNNFNVIVRSQQPDKLITDTASFENRISAIDKQIKKLLDLYQFGDFDVHDLKQRIEALKNEKSMLLLEIENSQDTDYESISESLHFVSESWDDLSDDKIRSYLFEIIDRIYVNPNGSVTIKMKVAK